MRLGRDRTINPRVPIEDPLAVVPIVPDNVEQRRDERGLLHLRLHVQLAGFRRRLARWLGYDYSRRFELDEAGTAFYQLVDGRRSLREIIAALAERGGCGADRRSLERAAVLYTKTLMTRSMLVLKVPAGNGSAAGSRRDRDR